MLKQDQRFVELARNFEYYQKCPDYLPSIPSQFVKSMYKSRRTRLSDALKSASSNKLGLPTSEDDKEDMSMPMQQVVITQYLVSCVNVWMELPYGFAQLLIHFAS
jgi:hypothetical protein